MKVIIKACIFIAIIMANNVFAANQIVNLNVAYKTVSFAGKTSQAIAINNQIPAPTLHFKLGDQVTINVHNNLDKETAIHWHGLLVPWQMDGVLGVSQQGIKPGETFQYHFTVMQSGTYWYHAHAGLQEQQGLYGAFLIDPLNKPTYRYNKDYVIVLSDWSNTNPDNILANLKKDGDYYSPRFPLQPSLAKFIHDYQKASSTERQNLIDDYEMMQQMRMGLYDISDVAYDAFLLNGKPSTSPWTAPVNVGDTVRLRFIGAAGDTVFRVKIPGTTMQMVHVQGNDVKPYAINEFTIAPGETYDVLVKIQKNNPYIIYAEATNTSGAAYGALKTFLDQFVDYRNVMPFPEPLPVTREMMTMMMNNMQYSPMPAPIVKSSRHNTMSMPMDPMNMHDMSMHDMDAMPKKPIVKMPTTHVMNHAMKMHGMKMKHAMNHSMSMPTEPAIIGDSFTNPTSTYTTPMGTKYQPITAAVQTNDPNKPISKVINMELFGYMGHFIWFINGVPEYNAKPIPLNPGKRYRIVFTNNSMMHHPMHIHGHWFILRKGDGAYDPLLHTIDVPPGATITADIDTDASGQWFFHCHFLYHMVAGMSRVFQYSTLIEITHGEAKPQNTIKQTAYHNRPIVRVDEVRPIDPSLVHHPMAHPTGFWFATFLDIGADPFNNTQKLTYKGLYGPDYNKLELFMNDAEMDKGKIDNADIDIFYWHLLNQFWSVKGGVNYFYRPAASPYWQPGVGVEGLMPYFIDIDARAYYYGGSLKSDIELSRDTQITNNFFVRLGARGILATKTVSSAAIGSGINQMRYMARPYYRLMPGLNLFVEYEHEQDYGAFKRIQINEGDPTVQNTVTLGVSLLF